MPRIIAKADLILTNSFFTKSEITKYYGTSEEKIVVAHLGLSDRFKPTINKTILSKYGINKEYFLFLGTIEPRKNIQKLIQAYELYRENQPNSQIQLIIAGRVGWKARKIVKAKYESEYNEDIIFLGYIDRSDMPSLYSSAKAFIYPSLYEGFGLPIIEALACGTKVIASNRSSLGEIGGEFATYFNPDSIEDMATCIFEVSSERNITSESRLQVIYAQGFTWQKTAQKFLQAVERL